MRRRHVLERLFAATTGWLSSSARTGAASHTVQNARPAEPTPGRDDNFSVKAFGAIGDGIADDAGAIQAAITAASSHGIRVRGSGGTDPYTDADRLGGVVYFAPGRYMISRPLILPRSGAYTAHAI